MKWSPETAAHVLGIVFKTIYNWIHHGLLKIKVSDLPDKGIRRKRQSDVRRRVFAHGRSIEKRPKTVQLRQEFGHFEVDTMQSGKTHGDVLVTITERPSLYKATIDDLNSVEYLLAFIIKKPILDYLGLCPRNKAIRIFSIRAQNFFIG